MQGPRSTGCSFSVATLREIPDDQIPGSDTMTDATLSIYRGPYEPVWTRHNSRYVVLEGLYMASLCDHSQKLFEGERR